MIEREKMNLYFWLLSLLILSQYQSGWGQDKYKTRALQDNEYRQGAIIDARNNRPVASVPFIYNDRVTVTDDKGKFALRDNEILRLEGLAQTIQIEGYKVEKVNPTRDNYIYIFVHPDPAQKILLGFSERIAELNQIIKDLDLALQKQKDNNRQLSEEQKSLQGEISGLRSKIQSQPTQEANPEYNGLKYQLDQKERELELLQKKIGWADSLERYLRDHKQEFIREAIDEENLNQVLSDRGQFAISHQNQAMLILFTLVILLFVFWYYRKSQKLAEKVREINELNNTLDKTARAEKESNDRLVKSQEQLKGKNHELAESIEKLDKTNHELEKINEQLIASNDVNTQLNDELKAKNAELESATRELQEKNGELQLKSGELRNKNGELESATRELKEKNEELKKAKQEVEKLIQANLVRMKRYEREDAIQKFQENLKASIKVDNIVLNEFVPYQQINWKLNPNINVLLGRNGYGKTHLLRSIVSLLQKDEEKTREIFQHNSENLYAQIDLIKNGNDYSINHKDGYFEDVIGKVPILAIPDARYLNKSRESISLIEDIRGSLGESGAYHFLYQKPVENLVMNFLTKICIDYLSHGRSFERPIFYLIRDVVEELTQESDYKFQFHKIEEIKGTVSFKIEVITEGNPKPLPLQMASQGTLSILSIFGLIYNYLESLYPDATSVELLEKPGIVFIDEIDAHLHPSWQQKIISLLRDKFPNVQFILTAHSPLVVAGCLDGEVSVLRKDGSGFVLEQFEKDFIGVKVSQLYETIFEIEEKDESYKKLSIDALYRDNIAARIEILENKEDKGEITEQESKELETLYNEEHYIRRFLRARKHREADENLAFDNEYLRNELKKLRSEIKKNTSNN